MFTMVLEPQSSELRVLLCSHRVNENECPFKQMRAALRKAKLNALLLNLCFFEHSWKICHGFRLAEPLLLMKFLICCSSEPVLTLFSIPGV